MDDQLFIHREEPSPDRIEEIGNWASYKGLSVGLYCKPYGGMWTSPVSSEWGWKDWCEREDWLCEDDETYRLTVADDVDVYTINTLDDLLELIDDHGRTDDILKQGRYVDYESAFTEYDGIYVTEQGQQKTRLSPEANLYGWDVECVLWDDWHFTNVEKV